MKDKMKILFFGTPDIAVLYLKKLVESHAPEGAGFIEVVTSADKPKGRGYKVTCSPVKEYADLNNLKVYQPKFCKDENFLKEISQVNIDLGVVVSFGQILPKSLFSLPTYGSINVHFSLLPKYRGAAPVNWAIINGETKTGVSIIYVEEKLDSGDIILQLEEPIKEDDDAFSLMERLINISTIKLLDVIELVTNGKVAKIKQDETKVSYAPKIKKEDTSINWQSSSRDIFNFIRGLSPEPAACSKLNGKTIKILKSEILEEGKKLTQTPGEILECIKNKGWKVSTSDGSLIIKMIKPEGKKLMSVDEYMRGNRIPENVRFEDR
ncbi:MAG: methionyl-tRNA formyltransferase [Candidatus Firestonebacteria bacterium]